MCVDSIPPNRKIYKDTYKDTAATFVPIKI